jgi:hypothetical protein
LKATSITKLPPIARVEVRCRREDLVILKSEIKSDGLWDHLASGKFLENKRAAVDAYILNALSSRNLDVRNFSDPYGDILLADIVVSEGE